MFFLSRCVSSLHLSFRSLLFSFRVAKWPKIFSPLKSVELEHPVSVHSATIGAFFFPVPAFAVSNLTLFVCNRKPARALFSRGSIRNYKSNKTNVYLPLCLNICSKWEQQTETQFKHTFKPSMITAGEMQQQLKT